MSDLRKAAQAVVDLWYLGALGDVDMECLRAALAQPEQELFVANEKVDDCAIKFFRRGGEQVGKLDFNGPKMTFEGDADASVDAFVKAFAGWFYFRVKEVAAAQGIGENSLAQPERKPLTEDDIELAYREIWRDLSDGFSHTSVEWIEAGIRYAEKVHGIE